ncbi:MAG TPA: hypothetical protein VD947_03900, partial [Patescibacteria group bacterium]|nr:hypothetical protein [Patescibacteria group bacterium]
MKNNNQASSFCLSITQIVIYGLFLVGLVIVSFFFAPKVSAGTFYPNDVPSHNAVSSKTGDTNWYPEQFTSGPNQGRWFDGSKDAYNCAWGSHWDLNGSKAPQDDGACDTGLPAAKTRYKLFQSTAGGGPHGTSIYLNGACRGVSLDGGTPYRKPDDPNKGDRKIKITINKTLKGGGIGSQEWEADNYPGGSANGTCSGANLQVHVPASAFTKNQKDRYGDSWYTALVVIEKLDKGQQMFRLEYSGGQVYGDDDGTFALGSRQKGGNTNYTFYFQTDCRFKDGDPVNFGFYDIDANQLQENGGPIRLTVVEVGGSPVAVGQVIPSSKQYSIGSGKMKRLTRYMLTFSNVDDNNGIRFDLPYSEHAFYPCPPILPESADVLTACDSVSFTIPNDERTTPSGSSPNRRHFAVYVNDGTSSGVPGTDYQKDNNYDAVDGSVLSSGYDYSSYSFQAPATPDGEGSNGVRKGRNVKIDFKIGAMYLMSDDWSTIESHRNLDKTTLKSGSIEVTTVMFNAYGSGRVQVWERFTQTVNNCYQATCSVNIIENVPPGTEDNNTNAVQAESWVNVIMTIHNTSDHHALPWRIGGTPLGLTSRGGSWDIGTSYDNTIGIYDIPAGGEASASRWFQAKGTIGYENLAPSPDYWGKLALWEGNCNTTAEVY